MEITLWKAIDTNLPVVPTYFSLVKNKTKVSYRYSRVGVDSEEVCVDGEHLSTDHIAHRWAHHRHCVVYTCGQENIKMLKK